ncbi:MAG: TIGR04283 family arsenosugar biosynthesis glycosyltransferase [Bacteroidota bacterium]
MTLSIIIPAFNEAANIGKLVHYLREQGGDTVKEIIVSDGGSSDDTLQRAAAAGANAVASPQKGRGAQMNYGASLTSGDILYFVHADVFPPESFVADISEAVQKGYDMGRYIMKFNTKKWYLRINEWFTRFDWFVCCGGDQTLFIRRQLFEDSGGFRNDMRIMEDFEFTKRVRQQKVRYKIFQKGALISDRKYDNNSWWRVQRANYAIVKMYKRGASQEDMVNKYRKMLDYR